ncbi:MAG: Gfo/Idh/MocA family oxidoreductase [Lachnospiraceae bacterium]|jgi:predicted dehydrogenase|nr:Gfo/Idh/MocA family oxidoreductase [Lachnospiraceae bacterium]
MKFLMIGLGSIGQRHLRNIRRIYGEDAQIIAYRVRGLQRTFSDTMQIRKNVSLEEEFRIRSFGDLQEALLEKPDIAFITNPTNMHIPCAIQCAKAGCHLFLEKPVSDSEEGLKELQTIAKEEGIKIFVGYQNRLNPAIARLKALLENKQLGVILNVRSVVGERLVTMHTYEDYKETYMARKDMGGGVVTNQMVHEMDYLRYLLGNPKDVYAVGGTLGNLGIDVEDNCEAIFTWADGERTFPVSVHADFYQSPPERYVQVVGTKGKAKADIIHNEIEWTVGDETFLEKYEEFERNDMFIEELKLFMEAVEQSVNPAIGFTDGILGVKMLLAVKESMKMGGKKIEFDF